MAPTSSKYIFFPLLFYVFFLCIHMYLINRICLICIVQEILKAQGIDKEPVFCTNGASRFDFAQGSVGKQSSLVKTGRKKLIFECLRGTLVVFVIYQATAGFWLLFPH